jgi:hypothetical protein
MFAKHAVRWLCMAAMVAVACRDATEPEPPPPCDGPIQVVVTRGDTPSFGWVGDCGISTLWVVAVVPPPEQEISVWAFSVSEQSPARPGISYGKAPNGAKTWQPPMPLVGGTTYKVSVGYTIGGDIQTAGGSATFTR